MATSYQDFNYTFQQFKKLSFLDIAYEGKSLIWFKGARWGNPLNIHAVVCPKCGVAHDAYFRPSVKTWQCKHCGHEFSLFSGTIFHGSKLPLKKILHAIYEFVQSKYGISGKGLSRRLQVSHSSALRLLHKLRELLHREMIASALAEPLAEEVHIDGCYLNFCNRLGKSLPNEEAKIELAKRRKGKRCLLVLAERCRPDERNGKGARRVVVTAATSENKKEVGDFVKRYVSTDKTTKLRTDGATCYPFLKNEWGYDHKAVKHKYTYCDKEGVHNNYAESVYSHFRNIQHTVKKISVPRLEYYGAEAAFRNTLGANICENEQILYLLNLMLTDFNNQNATKCTQINTPVAVENKVAIDKTAANDEVYLTAA